MPVDMFALSITSINRPRSITMIVPLLALALFLGCAAVTGSGRSADSMLSAAQAVKLAGAEQGFAMALDAAAAGDWETSYRFSSQVILNYPDTPWYKRALFHTERALIRLGRSSEAEAMMLRVQEEYPELADYAVYLMAEHHYSLSRFTRAAALYDHLTSRCPDSFLVQRAAFRKAQALLDSSSYTQASEAFERFLRLYPQSDLASEAGLGLARARAGAGDQDGSILAYQKVYVNYPGGSRDAEVEKALSLFSETGVAVPELTADELYRRGRNLFRTRQYGKAYPAFISALEKDPTHPRKTDMVLKAGVSLFHRGRRSEAAALLERSMKESARAGRGAEALNWLGKAYSRIGEREKAVEAYHKIVTKYPESEWADDALYLIGNVYRDANDTQNTLKFYGRLAADFPDSSLADSGLWWNAWTYYSTEEFAKAEETLRRLVARYPESFLVGQALYWQGRAREKQGDMGGAAARYRKTIKRSPYTYYGYLAAERLSNIEAVAQPVSADISGKMNAAEEGPDAATTNADEMQPVWTEEAVRALSSQPSFRRCLELMRLDMTEEAAAELWDLQERAKTKRGLLLGLSKTFFELGDYHRSLVLVLRNYENVLEGPAGSAPRDFWRLAYPQGYWDSILSRARRYGQDPYFIAAIIRQESHFQADALSPAGALGVMQVMPDTGAWAARSIGLSGFKRSMLLEYDVNINIGTWYVSRLMKRFRGDPFLVAAAYNAGPNAVAGWIGRNGQVPEKDEFVESIPYTETRWYVKRVLANYAEYLRIYGKNGGPAHFMSMAEAGDRDEEVAIP